MKIIRSVILVSFTIIFLLSQLINYSVFANTNLGLNQPLGSLLSLKNLDSQTESLSYDCNSVTDVSPTECQILVDLYEATDGANWTNNDGWLISNNVADWYVITLKDGFVSSIDLSVNKLTGSIPDSLGNLSNLVYLNLASNQLSGSIPESIGNLSNLNNLFLSSNQLSGSIPGSLGNLTNILFLHLILYPFKT